MTLADITGIYTLSLTREEVHMLSQAFHYGTAQARLIGALPLNAEKLCSRLGYLDMIAQGYMTREQADEYMAMDFAERNAQ